MYILLTILIVIAAILLTLLVLVQNSKGGGLAAGFGSGNQVMGVRKTTDFLEKATWTLIAIIALLSVFAVGAHKGAKIADENRSAISEQAQEAAEAATPVQGFGEDAPVALPENNNAE
ncbi:MAG TPA: preprotein translocase subunit SecG [Bacteroidales bacterium]|nr:preprotein translocase subunit SecG [Bacteroidales bacterium]